jgi:exopolysaccharide biosynthesis polyprenyl glycosylphosphotransferase
MPPPARMFDPIAWARIRLAVDAVVLSLAASAAVFGATDLGLSWTSRVIGAAFPFLILTILHLRRSPEDRISSSLMDNLTQILGVVSLGAMLVIALDSTLGAPHPVALALRLWVFSLFYLSIARASMRSIRAQALRTGTLGTPTLVVGAGVVGEHLVNRLRAQPGYGLNPVGILDWGPLADVALPGHAADDVVPLLDGSGGLLDAVMRTGARKVIVAFSSESDRLLVAALESCRRHGVEVALVPRMYELINERSTLDHVGGMPLLVLRPTDPRSWQFAVKHTIDRLVAAIALIVMSPLLAVIAFAIRCTSSGPILFRQRRVGRDGHEFDLLKFRTMAPNASEKQFEPPRGLAPGGVEGDDRRTRLGHLLRRSSLDELPQLFNVLRGDMSLVGPRPERPHFVARFNQEVARYESRHRVKSGITGWAQVHGLRGQTSITDRVEWDNFYIQNWSLRLDLRIAVLTLIEVFRFRG